jgi:hypothetical protein
MRESLRYDVRHTNGQLHGILEEARRWIVEKRIDESSRSVQPFVNRHDQDQTVLELPVERFGEN